jgi:hypothetical protein
MTTNLDEMAAMARQLIAAQLKVEVIEEQLKEAKEASRKLREEDIPCAMQEIGLTSFTMDTGEKVRIAQEVYASIPADNKAEAFRWLVAHQFGDLIKTEVSVSFGRGEAEEAGVLARDLKDKGLDASCTESVHPQTLKAFLKEQVTSGAAVPLELFGARPVWTAKISKK